MRAACALLLLLLASCATTNAAGKRVAKIVECAPHGGGDWLDVRSAHFHIRTNLDAADAKEQALKLERLLAALHLVHGVRPHATDRIEAIILANYDQLSDFTDYHGYAQHGGLFVLAADDEEYLKEMQKQFPGIRLTSTLTHELAHHAHAGVLVRSPRWISEALAAYEETIELSQDGTVATIGAESDGRLQNIYDRGALSLKDLWEWGDVGSASDETREYASAWAWMFFLFNKHKPQLDAFFTRLQNAEEPKAAFTAVFGADDEKLEKELEAFIAQGQYQKFPYTLPRVDETLTAVPLSPARVHLVRAELVRTAPNDDDEDDRKEKADAEIYQALVLDSKDPAVRYEQAKAAGTEAKREELTLALLKDDPNNAEAWYLLSQQLRRGEARKRMTEALEKTIALNPNHAEALHALAFYAAHDKKNLAEARARVLKAISIEPWEPYYADTLALIQAQSGECDAALASHRRAQELLSERANETQKRDLAKRRDEYVKLCAEAVKGTPPRRRRAETLGAFSARGGGPPALGCAPHAPTHGPSPRAARLPLGPRRQTRPGVRGLPRRAHRGRVQTTGRKNTSRTQRHRPHRQGRRRDVEGDRGARHRLLVVQRR